MTRRSAAEPALIIPFPFPVPVEAVMPDPSRLPADTLRKWRGIRVEAADVEGFSTQKRTATQAYTKSTSFAIWPNRGQPNCLDCFTSNLIDTWLSKGLGSESKL